MELAEPGLFRLRSRRPQTAVDEGIRFVLSAEGGLFFKQAGKRRKIHLIIVAPSFLPLTESRAVFLQIRR